MKEVFSEKDMQSKKYNDTYELGKPLTSSQKLNALAWAAKKSSFSYGELVSSLTATEMESIFEEYRLLKYVEQEKERLHLEKIRETKRISSSKHKRTKRRSK